MTPMDIVTRLRRFIDRADVDLRGYAWDELSEIDHDIAALKPAAATPDATLDEPLSWYLSEHLAERVSVGRLAEAIGCSIENADVIAGAFDRLKAELAKARDYRAARLTKYQDDVDEARKVAIAAETERDRLKTELAQFTNGVADLDDALRARPIAAQGAKQMSDNGGYIIRALATLLHASHADCGPAMAEADGMRELALKARAEHDALKGAARDMAERIVGRLRERGPDHEHRSWATFFADLVEREFLPAEKGTKT